MTFLLYRPNFRIIILQALDRMKRFGNKVLEVDPDNNDDSAEADDNDGDGFHIFHLMADASILRALSSTISSNACSGTY
jgi:hypothetical protein